MHNYYNNRAYMHGYYNTYIYYFINFSLSCLWLLSVSLSLSLSLSLCASFSFSLLLLAPTLAVLVISLTILVTGVAGFVGTHVSMALKQRGNGVLGLDNFNGSWMGMFTMEEVMNKLVGKFVTVVRGGGGGGGRIWENFV